MISVQGQYSLLKDKIRNMKFNNDFYPTPTEIPDLKWGTEWIPDSLYTILWDLIPSELKSTSTGQSVVQASASMLFSLGVKLDYSFGSTWLLDKLAQLGFSILWD